MKHMQPERRIVVRNSHSTRAEQAQTAIAEMQDSGTRLYVFETPSADPDETAEAFLNFMRPGDMVYSAAGDGTANQIANAVLESGYAHETALAFGPYGNFNDGSRSFGSVGMRQAFADQVPVTDLRPIETSINSEQLRSTMFYTTLGWTARVAGEFMDGNRQTMRQSNMKTVRSLAAAAKVYVTHGRDKLPEFARDGLPSSRKRSDLIFRNSSKMAKLIGGHDYTGSEEFGYRELAVGNLLASSPYLLKSLTSHSPDQSVDAVTIDFENPSPVWFMQDGESRLMPELAQFIALKREHGPSLQVVTNKTNSDR